MLGSAGFHAVFVTGRQHIGQLGGHDVWVMTAFEIVSVAVSARHLSDDQVSASFFFFLFFFLVPPLSFLFFSFSPFFLASI